MIGVLYSEPSEVRPFTDKQIDWLKISQSRASSPSRMRGCLPSCANPSNSRRRRPMY